MRPILNILEHKVFLKTTIIIYHLLYPVFIWYYKDSFLNLGETDAEQIFKLAGQSENWFELFGLGTQFMIFLSYPFVKIGISHLMLSILFSLISLKGFLIYTDLIYDNYSEKKDNIFLLLIIFLLLPSFHFWTGFIGKDAVVFYLMAIILLNIIKKKYRAISLFLAAFLILIIRPYLFFIIIFGYSISAFLNSDLTLKQKRNLLLTSFIFGIASLPILKTFLKLDSISFSKVKENFTKIITYSQQHGGSSIDLEHSNYFERLFIVLFRPFFYDAKSTLQYIVSAENAFIWFVIFILIKNASKINMLEFKKIIFPLSTSILLILFYSIYMYNLGLASRMRTMFLPYIFFTLFWVIKMKREEEHI